MSTIYKHNNEVIGIVNDNYPIYKRTNSDNRENLSREFTKRYGNEKNMQSFIFSSGKNALIMTLKTIIQQKGSNGIVLHGNELFGDMISKVIPNIHLEYPNVNFISFDVKNNIQFHELVEKHKNELICLYVESASNPSANMFDWSLLKRPEHARIFNFGQISILVDNTWLSSSVFNPFKFGANIVVESCAKYNSGGNAICGVTITNSKKTAQLLNETISLYGIHIPEHHCEIVLRNLMNLDTRIQIITNKTHDVIDIFYSKLQQKLKQISNIKQITQTQYENIINYCGLSNHSTYNILNKHCNNSLKLKCSGVFIMNIITTTTKSNIKQKLEQLYDKHNIPVAMSFGRDVESIDIQHYEYTTDNINIISVKLRVSIGVQTNVEKFAERLCLLFCEL